MPDHGSHLDLGGYVLENIDDAERKAFEAHLLVCDSCQLELQELTDVKSALSELASNPVPAAPNALRERTAAIVYGSDKASIADAQRNRRTLMATLAGLGCVVVGLLVILVLFVADRDDNALGMALVDADRTVVGDVVVTPSDTGRDVRLQVEDLALSGPQDIYECWFVTPAGDTVEQPDRISAGTFRVTEEGVTRVDLSVVAEARYPFVSVTREPLDGNPARTGPEVLHSYSE